MMEDISRSTSDEESWHALAIDAALAALGSDVEHGLGASEAARRLEQHGPNALPEGERRSAFSVFLRQFKSPLIYLLLIAALIAVLLREHTDAIVIVVVVCLNSVIGAAQEGRAERAVAALQRSSHHKARVLRDGHEQHVDARDVVPGDVLIVEAGDAVAADARVLEVAALQVAEAALTGESVPVGKAARELDPETALADRRNMIFAGTHVAGGRGRALVIATGPHTEIGRIAALAEAAEPPRTPLERRVDHFGRTVTIAALFVFVLLIGLGVLRGVALGEMLMIGVSALVGMVPEGLPVAMTIALAVGVQRMARRKAIVRRLSAVETLGSTTIICSDKTGTLTRNEMTVTQIVFPDGQQVSVSGVGYAPEGEYSLAGERVAAAQGSPLERLLSASVLCNDAQLEPAGDGRSRWRSVGDPTEIALLTAALKAGLEPSQLRARHPRRAELPFDPARKMMATAHESETGPFIVIKGAPEVVLELSASARHGERSLPLDDAARRAIRAAADGMASRALRVLAVAIIDGEGDLGGGFDALAGRPTLLGLLGQMDPPRSEVADAVASCQAAGIRPVVVTGDHKATGLSVARELGIAKDGDIAVDGVELAKLSAAELDSKLDAISVFARVHPAQKLRIIEAYQARHHVVAMTGDGVNDAPALVRANVGVAMGITGTEVAKDSAKIVIADDNFATIVAAIEEGRVVYRNIKKAVLLLAATSFAEVILLVLAMLLGYPPPFAAVQILWNNLVTEGVITINLIMEPAEGDEMAQAPIAPGEPLLTARLLTRMAVMIPTIVACTLGWFVYRRSIGIDPAVVQTETFTLLAICEWFNVLNCRSAKHSALTLGLLRNPWLLGGLVVGNALQVAVVYWPPLGSVFRTVPIALEQVWQLALVGSLVLWTEEARKLAVRWRERRAPAAGAPSASGAT